MTISRVLTNKAPAAIGPYSQAIAAGDFLFVSGQLGMDPSTGQFVEGGVEAEARQALSNMGAILEAAGTSFAKVVKCTVLLTAMSDFAAVNQIYAEFFQEPFPARAAYAVAALPKGGKVEIEAIAALR
jgi:2-iminobutanoate/2-iminopropanoate deaminase